MDDSKKLDSCKWSLAFRPTSENVERCHNLLPQQFCQQIRHTPLEVNPTNNKKLSDLNKKGETMTIDLQQYIS